MRNAMRSGVVVALAFVAALLAMPATASAAPTTVGYDVSYPQCGGSLPRDRAFAVIGVNGGLSTRSNPCLAAQLTWAWGSSGAVPAQPGAQLYLNTANPGELLDQVTTWPRSGATPYGSCDGTNTAACSWQYGWERAENSVDSIFTPAARTARVDSRTSSYTWWLDVETMNTWQSGGPEAQGRNRAALEGMTAYLVAGGGRVGVYSTAQQWSQIVGVVPAGSTLAGRDSWLAGSTTQTAALAACFKPALVPGGQVTLSQYVFDGLDRNQSCR
jgi:hypothetical protein